MPVFNGCSHSQLEEAMGWPIDCLYTNDHPEGGYNRRKLCICKNCYAVLAIPDDEFNNKYNHLRNRNKIVPISDLEE